ncbi:MAG: TonB-dependent receptor [Chromatiales bacterium]|nr:MAG: TonB-dependent receptor [Chromatiales bacterium]
MSVQTTQSRKFFLRSVVLGALATLLLPVTQPVQAQESGSSQGMEEIFVRATRRETDIQTTPVAVTAIDEQGFKDLFAFNIGDVALKVPNFSAAQITGFNAAGFAMRGASQTDILVYWEPPVGVLVDDFVVPHMQTQLLEPYDIEQVEILRGPQGTLFGKNTTAGVVSVRTKRPNFDGFATDASVLFGNHGRTELRGAVNVPIIEDRLAFRLAAMSQDSDGYYKNGKNSPGPGFDGNPVIGDRSEIGGVDAISARAKLLWTPTETLDILFQYEYLDDDGDSPPAVNETDPTSNQAFNLIGFPGVTSGDPLKQAGVSNRDDGLQMSEGHKINIDGYYLNIDWEIGNFDVTSVTGYRDQDSRLPSSYAGEVLGSIFDATRDDKRETWQQEIRVASDFDGPLNFVAGAFYQKDETSFNVLQYLGLLDLFGTGVPGVLDNDNPRIITNNQDLKSYAGFFDLTYDFAETWQFAGGIRFTTEEKKFFSRPATPIVAYGRTPDDYPFDPNNTGQFPCNPDPAAFDCQTDQEQWDEPTYRALISNQFTDDLYAYFSFSHGFKSGGYSDQAGSGIPQPLQAIRYDPEEADSFELGVKWDGFDDRLRLNSAIFYVEYDDMQRAVIQTLGLFQETVVFNAAEVTAWGVETEGTFILLDDLELNFNIGYLDTEYDEFELDVDLSTPGSANLDGEDVTRAPEWTMGFDLTYSYDWANIGNFRAIAGVYYEDESTFYYAIEGDQVLSQFNTEIEEHWLVDASVTYTHRSEKWFVSLFGKNLNDTTYRNASQYVGGLWTFSTYAPPRTYGIEVGVSL